MKAIQAPDLEDIRRAQDRLRGIATRTPLVKLQFEDTPAEIYLKLENLQPIGSFKLRGAGNAMMLAGPSGLADGVYTASAGNMAQGVAWNARRMGVRCQAIVPEDAPKTKLAAIERLGARPVPIPFDAWWRVILEHHYPGTPGLFIHPVSDPAVLAGNGTIGLEILEDLPDVDAVLIPYGGGGLSSGIGTAIKSLKPDVRILAAEVDTGAPFKASLEAGSVQSVTRTPSFVDGIGSAGVLPEMWDLARSVMDDSLVVTLKQVEEAIRMLATRNRVIAEGAGAVPLAAALTGRAGSGKVVCVISGGNIDTHVLASILRVDTGH